MEKLSKTLTRTVVLECYANKYARGALREIESAYREMLVEMVEYAIKHKASQSTLHKVFYEKFRGRYPWLPTRVIKGAYRDAVRRAKSFRERMKRGKVCKDEPEVRRVTITYSDSQDWRLEDGVIKLRTHRGWVELHYRNHKQLHRYLYSGWRLASELRFKILGRKVVVYLTLTREFEVSYRDSYLWLLTTQQISIMMRNCTAHSSSMAPLLEALSDVCGCEEERVWILGNVTSHSLTVNTTTAQLMWSSLTNRTVVNTTVVVAEIAGYPELWQLYNKTLELHLAKPVDDRYLVYYNVYENTVFCDWKRIAR